MKKNLIFFGNDVSLMQEQTGDIDLCGLVSTNEPYHSSVKFGRTYEFCDHIYVPVIDGKNNVKNKEVSIQELYDLCDAIETPVISNDNSSSFALLFDMFISDTLFSFCNKSRDESGDECILKVSSLIDKFINTFGPEQLFSSLPDDFYDMLKDLFGKFGSFDVIENKVSSVIELGLFNYKQMLSRFCNTKIPADLINFFNENELEVFREFVDNTLSKFGNIEHLSDLLLKIDCLRDEMSKIVSDENRNKCIDYQIAIYENLLRYLEFSLVIKDAIKKLAKVDSMRIYFSNIKQMLVDRQTDRLIDIIFGSLIGADFTFRKIEFDFDINPSNFNDSDLISIGRLIDRFMRHIRFDTFINRVSIVINEGIDKSFASNVGFTGVRDNVCSDLISRIEKNNLGSQEITKFIESNFSSFDVNDITDLIIKYNFCSSDIMFLINCGKYLFKSDKIHDIIDTGKLDSDSIFKIIKSDKFVFGYYDILGIINKKFLSKKHISEIGKIDKYSNYDYSKIENFNKDKINKVGDARTRGHEVRNNNSKSHVLFDIGVLEKIFYAFVICCVVFFILYLANDNGNFYSKNEKVINDA